MAIDTQPSSEEGNVIGYYRYTDIMFEWYKSTPEASVEQLKAFLYPGCLVAPENPLSSPGGGIELYLGTLKATNEIRLLFTSKQIEYTRYWLYEMEITPDKVPIPGVGYILTEDKFKSLTPTLYKTGTDLKRALKDLTKANKRLKDVDTEIQGMRDLFESARKLYQSVELRKTATWCAIDIEQWERDHAIITEIGYSAISWTSSPPTETPSKDPPQHDQLQEHREREHWIVKNSYRNGTFVPDNRDWYHYGTSTHLTRKELQQRLLDLLSSFSARGPLFLIFHDHRGDLDTLAALGVDTKDYIYRIPEKDPPRGVFCIDTRRVFGALEGHKEPKSLSKICRILGLTGFEHYHNAGNDAEYTLRAFESMAGGTQIDTQREMRWPSKPTEP
ncbi:hypothetical protein FRB99_003386, partial [Tulasnella sp. 403]